MAETYSVKETLAPAIEAVLFIYGEPITFARLATILSDHSGEVRVTEEDVRAGVRALEERLRSSGSGLSLVIRDGEVQIVTRGDLKMLVESIAKEEFKGELTPAALETLAIIIFSGEVPRSTIDYIRGVNSSFIVRNLLVRGFLDRIPDPKRGNIYRYKPSFALLRHLGIDRAETLPDYAKFRDILAKFSPQ